MKSTIRGIVALCVACVVPARSAGTGPFAPYGNGRAPEVIREIESGKPAPAGVTVRRLIFRSRNSEIFAVVARPQGAGRYPGILVLHGGGGNAEEEKAIAWAQRGYIAVAPDLPGIAEPGKVPNSTGPWKSLKYGEGRYTANPDATASTLFDAVVAGLQALDLLRAQPGVDRRRIGIAGISWGGYMTTMLSGLAGKRVRAAFSVYGCGFYELTSQNSALQKMPPAERAVWLRDLDAGRQARGIRAAFFLAAATNDFFFWPPAVMATLREIPGYRNQLFSPNVSHSAPVPGGSKGASAGNWLSMEVAFFEYYLRGRGQPLPRLTARFESGKLILNMPAEVWCSATSETWTDRKWISVSNGALEAAVPGEIHGAADCFATASDARPVTVSSDMIRVPY